MIIKEYLGKLTHLNDPVPNDLNLRVADQQASIEIFMHRSPNKEPNDCILFMVLDDNRCPNHSIPNINIHRYLLIITHIPIGIDKLSNNHLLILLLQMLILFFIIVTNNPIVAISIIVTKQVQVLLMMNILLQFQKTIVIIFSLFQCSYSILDGRVDVILLIDCCHDISIFVHHSVVDYFVYAYIEALAQHEMSWLVLPYGSVSSVSDESGVCCCQNQTTCDQEPR